MKIDSFGIRASMPRTGGISISVIDRGQGIAPDDVQRIFDEFSTEMPAEHLEEYAERVYSLR